MMRAALSVLRNRVGIRTPVLLQLKPTYRCNMRCGFCTVWSSKKKEAGTKEFCKIIYHGRSLGAGIVNFSGGEPLLRDDIVELVSYAKKKGFVTMMNTNGFLMPAYASALKGQLDQCIISIDFPDARQHDAFRGLKGAFKGAVNAIRLAKKNGIKARINCVVMAKNAHCLEEMALFAEKLGASISFLPFIPERMDKAADGLFMHIREYADAVKMVKEKHDVGPEDFFIDAIVRQDFRCRATDTVINVQPDGRFELPCEVKPIAHGNALDLIHEYRSKRVKEISRKNGKYPFCRGCTSQCSLLPSLLVNPMNAMKAYIKRN